MLASAYSETVPVATALMTAEELREAANLWGDDSFDVELTRLQSVGIEHLQRVYGVSITATERRDYYPGLDERLRLSGGATSVELQRKLSTAADWDAFDVDAYSIEENEQPPIVHVLSETVSSFENDKIETVPMLPIRAVCNVGIETTSGVGMAAREAVRKMVAHLFYSRPNQGGSADTVATYATTIGFMTPALYMEVRRLMEPYAIENGFSSRPPEWVATC